MAGEKLSLDELKEWYANFNNILSNYGGTIGTLPEPDGGLVVPEDINAVYDKIEAMKNDEFLGSITNVEGYEDTYSDYTLVSSKNKIKRTDVSSLINSNSKITDIKCRNTTTYTNSYNNHQTNSHGSKENTDNSHGTKGNGENSDGLHGNLNNANGQWSNSGNTDGWRNHSLCYWSSKGNGTWNHGAQTNGKKTHGTNDHTTKTNTAKSNESYKDVLNVHTTENRN